MNNEIKRIVIVTDCVDVASNEIRASIISELEKIKSKIKVEIEPPIFADNFSVSSGNFLVRLVSELYDPKSTIFLAILNPLRTDRKDRARIIGKTKNGFHFVGENTGVFGWLFEDFGIDEIYESSKKGLDGENFISFGEKYIHAPIAARIASGIPVKNIGKKFDKNNITFLKKREGEVLYIDNFGVYKIFIKDNSFKDNQYLKIYVNGVFKCDAIYTNAMKNLEDGVFAVYRGSSLGLLEVGLVRGNATLKIGAKIGDIIEIK